MVWFLGPMCMMALLLGPLGFPHFLKLWSGFRALGIEEHWACIEVLELGVSCSMCIYIQVCEDLHMHVSL